MKFFLNPIKRQEIETSQSTGAKSNDPACLGKISTSTSLKIQYVTDVKTIKNSLDSKRMSAEIANGTSERSKS